MRLMALALLAGCEGLQLSTSGEQTGYSSGCGNFDCTDGFVLEFWRSSWPAGDYEILVDADGEDIRCTAHLPVDGPSEDVCDSTDAVIGLVTGADPEDHAIAELVLYNTRAASIEVVVSRDGELMARQTFEPTYQEVWPNGEGCEPVCHEADAFMEIP